MICWANGGEGEDLKMVAGAGGEEKEQESSSESIPSHRSHAHTHTRLHLYTPKMFLKKKKKLKIWKEAFTLQVQRSIFNFSNLVKAQAQRNFTVTAHTPNRLVELRVDGEATKRALLLCFGKE